MIIKGGRILAMKTVNIILNPPISYPTPVDKEHEIEPGDYCAIAAKS